MLRRRHKRHPPEGPWIIFEGGGKRTYRRRKTKAERQYDLAGKKLRDWGKEIMREEISEAMYGRKPPPDQLGHKAWIAWARKQIDLDQNAKGKCISSS